MLPDFAALIFMWHNDRQHRWEAWACGDLAGWVADEVVLDYPRRRLFLQRLGSRFAKYL